MPSALTPALIRQHVRAIQAKLPDADIIGIQASDTWTGPSTLDIAGREIDVVSVISPLQVRELMADRRENARPLVLLTGLTAQELGLDVISRLAGRQLMTPDAWALVIDAFKARDLDPRLLKHRWMATALLEAMPIAGYPPVAAGVLDSETAWALVLEGRLGLRVSRPDAVSPAQPSVVEQLLASPVFRAQRMQHARFNSMTRVSARCSSTSLDVVSRSRPGSIRAPSKS